MSLTDNFSLNAKLTWKLLAQIFREKTRIHLQPFERECWILSLSKSTRRELCCVSKAKRLAGENSTAHDSEYYLI